MRGRPARINAAALGGVATQEIREQLELRSKLDMTFSLELELRRREQAEKSKPGSRIESHHLAYVEAFPLRQYIYESFPILEPGRVYKNNWHIDAITELLQAATVGEIKNFLINLPRRGMKSSLVCVMWQTWVWTFLPYSRWLFSSFSEKFAMRDSENCRKLINSEWYQQRFGDVFQMSQTENTRRKFANNKGGFRACFGVGKGTGDGGDFVICDDPHQIDEAESDRVVEKTVQWWHGTMYNSVTDPVTAVRGIVHQRVSEKDLTGDILARELGYTLLCLPMTFENDHPHRNSVSKPLRLGKVSAFEKSAHPELEVGEEKLWVDPRDTEAKTFDNKWYKRWYNESYKSLGLKSTGDGEIMWPNRFTKEVIEEIKSEIEVYGESAQLQQRPIRRGGNFFNTPDFKPLVKRHNVDFNGMSFCRVWDKAGTQGKGDWTVGMLLARTQKRPFELYICDIVRAQVGYYDRMKLMKETCEQDRHDIIEGLKNAEYSIIIERELASAGKDLSTIEKDYLIGFHVVMDIPRGKKAWRAKPVKSMSEAGRIKVIEAPWNSTFFRELERFEPEKDNNQDDQIDTLSSGTKFLIFGTATRRSSFSGMR